MRTQRELDKYHAAFFSLFKIFNFRKKGSSNFKWRMTSTDICINDQRMPWPFRLANALRSFIPLRLIFLPLLFSNEDQYMNDICFSWEINISWNRIMGQVHNSPFLTSSPVFLTWSRGWNYKAKRRLWMNYIHRNGFTIFQFQEWTLNTVNASRGWMKGGRGAQIT